MFQESIGDKVDTMIDTIFFKLDHYKINRMIIRQTGSLKLKKMVEVRFLVKNRLALIALLVVTEGGALREMRRLSGKALDLQGG